MMYICSECGYQIPDDAEFCHQCGCLRSKALRMDDRGYVDEGRCHNCGQPFRGDEFFCGSCGTALVRTSNPRGKLDGKGILALILALVPGFFNVFGLGHLVLRQWSRGVMFLGLTAVLWWITPTFQATSPIMLMLLQVGLFMYQAMDIFRFVNLGGTR